MATDYSSTQFHPRHRLVLRETFYLPLLLRLAAGDLSETPVRSDHEVWVEDFDSFGTDQSFNHRIDRFVERVNPVRKGGALNPTNKKLIFFLSFLLQGAGFSNGVKREAKNDHSITEGFKSNVRVFLFQAYHGSISGRESASGETVEGNSIF